jgi:transposase
MTSPGPNPKPVIVPEKVRGDLDFLANSSVTAYHVVMRAQAVQLSAAGMGTADVARRLGTSARWVRKWKARFRADPTTRSLEDLDRSGRPSEVPVTTRCRLVQLACERPDDTDNKRVVPFRDIWTYATLADALEDATGVRISVSEVGRILRFEDLRPHRIRQWLHSPDPDFGEKAARVCETYLTPVPGRIVVCVDEKPLFIRSKKHPTHSGPKARVRVEYEYVRHGTAALLAGFRIDSGEVFGVVRPDRKADTLVDFMDALAARWPDHDVVVVWDNLNTHYDGPAKRWAEFNARHGERFSFVYTPIHASWMNQVEVWFSIIERRILRYGSFASYDDIKNAVEGFIEHWNLKEAHPFRWTWRSENKQTRCTKAA